MKVGSGKSYTILGHISSKTNIIRSSNKYNGLVEWPLNLIVVPHNIYVQWIDYIQLFAPNLDWIGIGSQNDYKRAQSKISTTPIVIIKNTMLKFLIIPKNVYITRLVIDEIDNISLSFSNLIFARYTWLISSTLLETRKINFCSPSAVLKYYFNHYHDDTNWTWELRIECCPIITCDEDFITTSFNIPLPIIKKYTVRNLGRFDQFFEKKNS